MSEQSTEPCRVENSSKGQDILCSSIFTLIDDHEHMDITLQVGDPKSTPTCIFAHKYILASRSDVFKSMFFNGFKEETVSIVPIPNISYDTFLLMLQYIYSGDVIITNSNVMKLLEAVDQYDLTDLRSMCYEFLVKNLNLESCCDMILKAQNGFYQFNCDELIKSCMSLVSKRADQIVKMDVFLEFDESVIIELVQSEEIKISESDLFKAVIRWGLEQKKHTGLTLEETVRNIVPYLRLPLIEGKELMRIVRATNVVPIDLYIEALEYASAPNSVHSSHKKYQPRGFRHQFALEVPQKYIANFDVQKSSVTKIAGGTSWDNSTVYGDLKLNTGVHFWEITIDHIPGTDMSGLVFGLTTEAKKMANNAYFSKDIAVGMGGNTYNCSGTLPICQIGDVIGILINFKSLKMNVFKNGIQTNVVGNLKKSTSYYPVFHVYYPLSAFTVDFPTKSPIVK